MPDEVNGNQQLDAKVLRDTIRRVFPAETYTGRVTAFDGAFTPDTDDEEELFKGLQGRTWTQVERSLRNSQPGGFVFLTDKAYRAFIAAWLFFSLEEMDAENQVRDFVLFTFGRSAQGLRVLNPEQRSTVSDS